MLQDLNINADWNSFLSFRSRRLKGLQTGILPLDKILLGLSGITLVQGAPGSMKSTLVLQVAAHNAALGVPTIILDRENGKERFRMRLICCQAQKSSVDVLTASEEELSEWIAPLVALPIFHSTSPTAPQELRALIDEALEHFNRPLLVVVDSLQSMPPLADNERMSIQQWLNELDQIKLDYEGRVTMLVTSEKSRGSDNYEKASMSAAKGAGAIEYKSELILDLRRAKDGTLVCEVVKSRDGISNVAVDLEPVFSDSKNPNSFCFRLIAK